VSVLWHFSQTATRGNGAWAFSVWHFRVSKGANDSARTSAAGGQYNASAERNWRSKRYPRAPPTLIPTVHLAFDFF
jgi:hypothetical protein